MLVVWVWGNSGLDNLKGADIELQEKIFIQQIQIANQSKSPVVITLRKGF